MADTIKFTDKKFLDEAGLKKVFELLKNNYGADIEALKKLVGSWSEASEETVIQAIEEIREQIGDFDSAQLESIVAAIVTNQGDIKDLQDAIADLDLPEVGGAGKIITTVSQTDGKVSATASELTSDDKTVTVNGLDLAVNIDGDTIVKGTDGKLSVSASATAVSGKEAIVVTNVTEGGKEVTLKIDSEDKVLSQGEAGLLASLELKYTPKTDTTNGKIELIGKDGVVIGTAIDTTDFTVDGFLDSVAWKGDGSNVLVFTWNTATQGKTSTEIDLTKYIDTYTNGDGLNLDSDTKTFSVKVKDGDKYLTVDGDGVASKGIDDAIEAAVGDLEDKLTGDAEELTDLGKVEDKIEELEGSLKTTIEGLDADVTSTGGEFVTVKVTEEDGVITAVTVTENDIASETALNAEIAARKAVTGVDANAYTANGSTNYLKTVGSLKAADEALDAALKGVADRVDTIETDYIKYENLQPLTETEIVALFNGTPANGQG